MFFGGHQFRGFDGNSVRIKGAKTLYLSVLHTKHTANLLVDRPALTGLDAIMTIRVSG